jgi:putative IMPACT (imprinted ancient) family translation regulator
MKYIFIRKSPRSQTIVTEHNKKEEFQAILDKYKAKGWFCQVVEK